MSKTVELVFESSTKNYHRYGLKSDGYIVTAYISKGDKRPKSVKLVVDENE